MVARVNNLHQFGIMPRAHSSGERVARAIGDVMNAMGSRAFVMGLAGLAVIGFLVTAGSISTTLLTVPTIFALAGGAACLVGATLQGLGRREVTDFNFSKII